MIKFKPTNRVTKDHLDSHDIEHNDNGTPQSDKYKDNISNDNNTVTVNKKNIIEKILGNNNILTNNYIKDTINLTKSIVIKNDNEAIHYNKYINLKYSSHQIDITDKSTWRYYKQLNCEYHILDTPITLTSLDNGSVIILTKDTLNLHRKTKSELLKFSLFYKELIDKFPEQELYVKSVIAYNKYSNINDIINLEDFSIVSYDSSYIEENENDLIYELQESINNYKNIRLIPYYSLSDNLFLASQYHILYNFMLTKVLSIRLKNAKTLKAHTYHIKNYLASHHFLDEYYNYLTKKQSLFLYRNLLYLDNHSGRNDIFRILIDKLFTDRNISIVNYRYKQINELDDNNNIKYKFNQKLLNNANLVYSVNDYLLDDIKDKEYNLTEGNPNEWTYCHDRIDNKFKNSLFNLLLTKDLETIIIDNTDTVKYKLIPTIIDYWAYLLKTNRIDFLITIVDPVSNKEIKLNTKDLFKLFIVILFKTNEIQLTEFPDYTIQRVFKETLPDNDYLLNLCFNKYYWYHDTLDEIKANIPAYSYITTSTQCEQYISSIYKLNIGLWLLLTNFDDSTTNGQFELIIDKLNMTETYSFNDETVTNFINRINLENLMDYSNSTLEMLVYSILNNIYDNKLDFLNKYKYIQQSLIEVFKKFNSYTVQLINNYYSSSPILSGPKDVRFYTSEDINTKLYHYDFYLLNVNMDYKIKDNDSLYFTDDSSHGYKYKSIEYIDISLNNKFDYKMLSNINVLFNNKILNDLGENNWLVNQSSDDQLEFLAMNL